MTVMITCPSCQRSMKGPDSVIGKTVKCPACQMQFAVTGGPPPSAPEPLVAPLAVDFAEPSEPRKRSGGTFWDYIVFRRMITPIFIQIVFWTGVAVIVILGLLRAVFSLNVSILDVVLGLLIVLVGPLLWRMYCETLIVFFRMNETLTDIRHGIDRMRKD